MAWTDALWRVHRTYAADLKRRMGRSCSRVVGSGPSARLFVYCQLRVGVRVGRRPAPRHRIPRFAWLS